MARLEGTGSKGFYAQAGDLARLEDELADILINVAGLANSYQLDLAGAMERKRSRFVEEHGTAALEAGLDEDPHPRSSPSVTVYCSSSSRLDPVYHAAAAALGTAIGQRGWTLVYGGGSRGLMGTVSRAAQAEGGEVRGIILDVLLDRGGDNSHVRQLRSVSTMRSRKRGLEEASDAFVAMPGGFGTFEEILEILSFKQLGFHRRPVILLNTAGYYDALVAQFERCYADDFADRQADLFVVADTADAVITTIEARRPVGEPSGARP